jgi:inositol-1,3,4-trisphosphate 5/6-kinase/inositol-tetrakisphosphate 1-kinase
MADRPNDNAMSSHTKDDAVSKPQHQNTIHPQQQDEPLLDNIIVGYAFGPKKMETMGLIMAEASKALSTVITPIIAYPEESSTLTIADHKSFGEKEERTYYFPDDCDDEDARSFSSTRASSIASFRSLRGCGGSSSGIQLTFLPDSSGLIPIRTNGVSGDGDQSVAEDLSMVTATTTMATSTAMSSFQSTPGSKYKSMDGSCTNNNLPSPSSQSSMRLGANGMKRHPIRVSFVPIDLDTPLQEQHGGKFDVILHKMTEDILCISKMLRSRQHNSGYACMDNKGNRIDEAIELLKYCNENLDHPVENTMTNTESTMLTRHQERAARRIQRLREYKEKAHPSCVLVDSPINILAVMSRADMAQVLSSCLEGVKTKGGIQVNTPRFRVVEEGEESAVASLANEMDSAGFCYPLIAKPLTAAGTKSSHHMGIVMARDGLLRLKTPCLLQEFCNHGGHLFKVYVLGESVWVFSRESLPNLPPGENEVPSREESDENKPTKSYVEFERPAGSRCYVEFNSQRPYPTLSDFGIASDSIDQTIDTTSRTNIVNEQEPISKKPRLDATSSNPFSAHNTNNPVLSELASYVTKEEIEPVTNTLRAAFGLDLFGFDVLVKHDQSNGLSKNSLDVKEILVVDVNYFPGYKEVPRFPSLLAQYLTQKAVETRVNHNSCKN